VDSAGLDRLLQRARKRDAQALEKLVDMYSSRVFGMLYRLTGSREAAEDLLQETFLRVVRMIGNYQHAGRFESWLFRIAANLARDHARRGRRRGQRATLEGSERDGAGAVPAVDPRTDPGARLLEREAGERLNACLHELPEMDREIIVLRHFSGLSFREIADVLEIPLGTALARAHRALRRLRESFREES